MHILLTDFLTCPRCGPAFGLILLADRLENRRVREGSLGCANCRGSYPVRQGVADLRVGPEDVLGLTGGPTEEAEVAFRTAALMGPPGLNASRLLVEQSGAVAAPLARILEETHLIAVSAIPPEDPEDAGVLSRIATGSRLPFRGNAFQGAAVLGEPSPALLADLPRTLVPGSRLVIDGAAAGICDRVTKFGLSVLLEQDGVVVAAAPGHR